MKLRVANWAAIGALVVILWTLCLVAGLISPTSPMRMLVYVTCPITLAGHHDLGFWLVLLVNAATYALVGLIVETIRQNYKPA